MVAVSSWGRLTSGDHRLSVLSDKASAGRVIQDSRPGIAYGNGRSYGDVCLNPGGTLWNTRGLDRFVAFDPATGRISGEAGVLLRDLQRLVIPQGWVLPVTPGTQLITLGGAIASDVHGKNHHVFGCFGEHVTKLRLLRTDGEIIDCGPDKRADWFCATVGGMGLTGVVVEAEVQLRRSQGPWIESQTLPFAGMEEFFQLSDGSEAGWEHTVSWIDCLNKDGRGLFMRGNPVGNPSGTEPSRSELSVPVTPPFSLINRLSLRPFNQAYFRLKKNNPERRVAHYEAFLHPLDKLNNWNRMYGPKGFYQYQSVVPRKDGLHATQEMLRAIAKSGEGSFLAVLKTFGDRPAAGMMSFPQHGVTLALDFPNRNAPTLNLLASLDAIVRAAGGRLYPAKDARMPRDLFLSGYPRLDVFLRYRDPGISSEMSRRLIGS